MRRLAFTLLLVATRPAAAQDNYREWLGVCLTGNACANFSVQLEYQPATTESNWVTEAPEGYTRITFGLANLQGLPTAPPASPWMIQYATVLGLSSTWTTRPTYVYYGIVESYQWFSDGEILQTSLEDGLHAPYNDRLANLEMQASHASWSDTGQYTFWLGGPHAWTGLWGCEFEPPTLEWGGRYVGCGSTLYVTMLAPGQWSLTDQTQIEFAGRMSPDYGTRQTCTTGTDCGTMNVPEPGSLLLLATGVFGVAYVRRRRA